MAGRSKIKAYVPVSTTQLDFKRPIDAGSVGTLINNATHLADVCGQVRVNAVVQSGSNIVEKEYNVSGDRFRKYAEWRFPWALKSSGEPYKMRWRAAGHNAGGGEIPTFHIVISDDPGRNPFYVYDSGSSNVLRFTGSSDSGIPREWHSGGVATLSRRITDEARVALFSMGDVSGSVDANEIWGGSYVLLYASVYVDTDHLLASGTIGDYRLTGLYISEWIG